VKLAALQLVFDHISIQARLAGWEASQPSPLLSKLKINSVLCFTSPWTMHSDDVQQPVINGCLLVSIGSLDILINERNIRWVAAFAAK
jgi:hypothetical protein